MLFANTNHGITFAKDPAVVHFGDTYYLYYTTWYPDIKKINIGIATSTDMESWQDVEEFSWTQECEQNGVGAPAAIVLDGKVHLFYQTYGQYQKDALCHAVSEDGIHFEKNPENPVYRPNDNWCCGRAIDADICVFDGKLYLYFATRSHDFKIQKIGGAVADLTSGFGKDAWTHLADQSLLTPELAWEQECIEAPATIVNDGQMFMFYGGAYNKSPQQIGCAVSTDGVLFRRVFDDPFLPVGEPGSWNSGESGHPYAFRDEDGRAYLFYQGFDADKNIWQLSKVEIAFDEANIPYIVE